MQGRPWEFPLQENRPFPDSPITAWLTSLPLEYIERRVGWPGAVVGRIHPILLPNPGGAVKIRSPVTVVAGDAKTEKLIVGAQQVASPDIQTE